MGAGERASADAGVAGQRDGVERRGIGRELHVAQLPHVELPSGGPLDPAEEDVRGRLHELLPHHHPLARLAERRGRGVLLEDAGHRLLRLHDDEVALVAALHEQDEGQQPHAADADDLVAHVDDVVAAEQLLAVAGKGGLVLLQEPGDALGRVVAHVQPQEQGRLVEEPALPVDHLRHLGDGRPAVAGAGLRRALLDALAGRRDPVRPGPLPQHVDADPVVPDREVAHPGVGLHAQPVLGRHGRRRRTHHVGRQVDVVAGEDERRRQAQDIPLEGSGIGLVEVVDVEDDAAIRGREHPEVRQVGITAELRDEAAVRPGGEVAGHHGGAAPVERERRDGHATVPQREQRLHPVGLLGGEHLDGIGAIGRRRVLRDGGPGKLAPGSAPRLLPLGHGGDPRALAQPHGCL